MVACSESTYFLSVIAVLTARRCNFLIDHIFLEEDNSVCISVTLIEFSSCVIIKLLVKSH